MRLISLFAGIGGFDLAARWMGWQTAVVVEIDPFCRAVLAKHFPRAHQHDDIKTFDATPYRGSIDLVCGGFPCQPFSTAGARKGNDDPRALWPQMLRIIREAAPAYVVAENVSGLLSQGGGVAFERVCTDLEGAGYTVQPLVLPACGVGAPHRRDRLWIVAYAQCGQLQRRGSAGVVVSQEAAHEGNERAQHGYAAGDCSAIAPDASSLRPQAGQSGELHQRTGAGAAQVGDEERAPLRAATDGRGAVPVAHADYERQQQPGGAIAEVGGWAGYGGEGLTPHADGFNGNDSGYGAGAVQRCHTPRLREEFRLTEPPLCRPDDGLPAGLVRTISTRAKQLKAYGNAIVPQVALQIFQALAEAAASH